MMMDLGLIDTISLAVYFVAGSWIAIKLGSMEHRIDRLEERNQELEQSLRQTGRHGFKLLKSLGEMQGKKLVSEVHMFSDESYFEDMDDNELEAFEMRERARAILKNADEISKK